jgi:hypothetical protein
MRSRPVAPCSFRGLLAVAGWLAVAALAHGQESMSGSTGGGSAPGGEGGGLSDSDSAVGYIDTAIPRTMFRFRADFAYDNNRPTRGEFFYATYQPDFLGLPGEPIYNGINGRVGAGPFQVPVVINPHGHGLPEPETSVDYQELSAYMEVALNKRFSVFAELPVRFLNPEINPDHTGVGDINVGFKYALLACDTRYLTFQARNYIPTGDSHEGLGTNHFSFEPGVLYFQRLLPGLALEAELKDWIPMGGTAVAGNVVRYGVGVNYRVYDRPGFWVAPVAEFVGWTFLSGKDEAVLTPEFIDIRNARGETVLNAKVGVRIGIGGAPDSDSEGMLKGADLYIGYGRPLTGDVFYKDILRVELRMRF